MAGELGGRFVLHHLLDVGVELLLSVDLVGCLDHHVGLDVELGQIKLELVLVAVDALPQVVVDFVLQVGGDGVAEQVLPLDALGRVHHQHLSYHVFDGRGELVGKGEGLFPDAHQQVDDVASCIGNSPEYHFVEADADGPYVCLAVIALPVQHLGSHVEGRAQDGLHLLVLSAQQLGEPKVSQLYDPFVLEHIGQLEISVHDFVLHQSFECV